MSNQLRYELLPGKLLGRHYRIVEFLGNGWEGEVYKVEEVATGIMRAAKLFYRHRYIDKNLPHVEYAKKLYRLRSCAIVIQYHHQDTIRIKGQSVDFLVSDFVDGEVLSQYIASQTQQRLLPFEALHLFYALVLGVEQIHFLGEYHGDIHADNIIIRKKGLHYEINLIDLMHLGKTSRARIQQDIYDLMAIFYEVIGGSKYYRYMPQPIKQIILGRKQHLIANRFKMAGHLRLYLENLEWE